MEALNFKILAALAHKALVFARQQLHAGHVGIGTTAPDAKPEIGGTSGVDGIKFPEGSIQTTSATGHILIT